MTLKCFFEELLRCDYLSKKAINKIPKTCCSKSNIEVYDIDELAINVSKTFKGRTFSSVDCLYLSNNDKYSLIEMKDLNEILKDTSKADNQKEAYAEKIDKIYKGINKKFTDTLIIFQLCPNIGKININGYEPQEIREKIQKNIEFIILLVGDEKTNPAQGLALSLLSLSAKKESNIIDFKEACKTLEKHTQEFSYWDRKISIQIMTEQQFIRKFN